MFLRDLSLRFWAWSMGLSNQRFVLKRSGLVGFDGSRSLGRTMQTYTNAHLVNDILQQAFEYL